MLFPYPIVIYSLVDGVRIIFPPEESGEARKDCIDIAGRFKYRSLIERKRGIMDPRIIPLYYLSSLAGLIMVAGGIWLIYKEKIYIDQESKQVTEIETPIGKFKTNLPALVLFALGFVPLIYPIVKSAGFAEEIRIQGNVKASTFPVQVYAVIRSDSLLESRGFSLEVPVVENAPGEYKILYMAGNLVLEERADLRRRQDGRIELPDKELLLSAEEQFEPARVEPVPPEFQ